MGKARFLSPWKDSHEKPVIYHCISRMVERWFALAEENGKKVREGLVRAINSDTDTGFDAGKWKEASRKYGRLLGMVLERKVLNSQSAAAGDGGPTEDRPHLSELEMAEMLKFQVRYFTDGAVICGMGFVNDERRR